MPIDSPKMQPWQVFHAANKHLTAETVARCFNREKRSAYAWGQDPVYTECRCKSPLELLHTLFELMHTVGLGYAARAGIEYLSTAIDPDVQVPGIKEPLPTIQEEILADYSAVGRLQSAIELGADLDATPDITISEAIEEIERLTQAVERTQSMQAPGAEHMPAEVASLIIAGPEALRALNKRRRAAGRKSQSKTTGGRA